MVIPSKITKEIQRNYAERGTFVKWMGIDDNKSKIMQWWKEQFTRKVSIRALNNDFFFIECISKNIRDRIILVEP